ncbi:MAG: hypothetical protein KKF78_03345 [Candidatus Omnitrophica bacterium]|nr:hypothetical protein [Candidatus Omnitrophota bacterium]MBU1996173.1 hypothetical protein [Candidatus Omnitrophota bacterium]
MTNTSTKDLLQIPEVVEEINRHLWIESEKSSVNIGFEKAAEDWITRFSEEWLSYHELADTVVKKKRRAKSYY